MNIGSRVEFQKSLEEFLKTQGIIYNTTFKVERDKTGAYKILSSSDIEDEWNNLSFKFGYDVSWLNKRFTDYKGHTYIIIGVRTNADRNGNCLKIKRLDGKDFCCSVRMVKQYKLH